MNPTITQFEKLLDTPRDNALLRFSLGNAYLKEGEALQAIQHLQNAVERDPKFSAAWKILGKAQQEAGQNEAAIATYTQGISVAEAKGDLQAAKEMRVFLKRLHSK